MCDIGSYHTRLTPRAIRAHITHFFTYHTHPLCDIHYYSKFIKILCWKLPNAFYWKMWKHRTGQILHNLYVAWHCLTSETDLIAYQWNLCYAIFPIFLFLFKNWTQNFLSIRRTAFWRFIWFLDSSYTWGFWSFEIILLEAGSHYQ